MEIWVLGTFEVSHSGRPVDIRGPLPRRLLALLALTPGREVSTDRLIDGLWGADPPAAAATTLQSHVARLRRDLPGPELVRTSRHGYAINITEDAVDALAFEHEVALGRKALAEGQVDEASALLGEALRLWRGTPYAEFADCEPLEADAQRLNVLRLDALESRISADLRRPGTAPPVAELEALVRWHPLRESFWALLMAAQYRSGRQADALASYQRARTTLAEELGVDPGPALQELERLILAHDPSLVMTGMSILLQTGLDRGSYADRVALVERAPLLEALTELHEETLAGSGRLVLVHGEAGVGKTALVREWSVGAGACSAVLWGACDPLSSPRPLGPLADVAPSLDPRVGELLHSGEREGLFDAALTALEDAGPAVFVIEDLQWADMSTLDLVRFLSRRLDGTRLLVVATYRDDQLGSSDPLRIMVGDIAPHPAVRRLPVPPLSPDAVAELVGDSGIDVDALYAETGGNAFFVTEVIASGGDQLPQTVQDAVLARTSRLSPQARLALESAAVVGSRVEPSLLHGMSGVSADAVDECVRAGMLQFTAPMYAFRHELVRQSVLSGILPGRLGALHWQALDRLRALPMSPRPLARLAEHAEMAGDPEAVLEFATAAGDSAAGLGSHREAAFQYGRAMPYAALLDTEERIELLGKRARECAIADQHESAIAAWQSQIDLLRGRGRDLEIVDALMGIDESYYTIGDASHGTAFVDEAAALLEGTPPSPQYAQTMNRTGSKFLLRGEYAECLPWYERALELADACGATVVTARSTANLAVAHFLLGDHEKGRQEAAESLRLCREAGLVAMAGKVCQTVAGLAWMDFELEEGLAAFEEAADWTSGHDLHGELLCVLASTISLKLDMGRWDEALDEAHDLLYVRNTGRASRIEPLMAIGLVGARRGDRDDVWAKLDEALELVRKSPTLDYQGFVALNRGEVHLLEGDLEAVRREALPWFEEAVRLGDADWLPKLTLLVWRSGLIQSPPAGLREPEVWSMTGRYRDASTFWTGVGMPCNAAWALLDSDDEIDLREARARFEQLGAAVLVERCDTKLRSIGARVPRGARASTRANVGGLTDREVEVLDLLDEGLRNADIATRLHLSEKTVGHHVSSILTKLGVSSRLEAVRRARDLAAVG
jgi:DNA-binding SARP family transcriptional activator/DNA-binding CsgD family transcriptional regulator